MRLGSTYTLIAVEPDASGGYGVGFWVEEGEARNGGVEKEGEGSGGRRAGRLDFVQETLKS
jgi:hypothetical protein